MKLILGFTLGLKFISFGCFAEASFLERFRNSGPGIMNEVPQKKYNSPQFISEKVDACRQDRSRHQILKKPSLLKFKMAELGSDMPDLFLENSEIEMNLASMDNKFKSGQSLVSPWSGDYWALRTGGIAKRYRDPEFPTVKSEWQMIYDHFLLRPPQEIDNEIHSPAEKYDTLVGDNKYSLTHANWQAGKEYNDRFGTVEKWMGLCHGWAPASYMELRPTSSRTIQAFNSDRSIVFSPDDMKALLTLKWSYGVNVTKDLAQIGTRFLGGRCNVKDPKIDPDTGRIVDPACFDLNPGAWHIVITNHVAGARRPLIIDATFDYEVWNQPVKSYSYRYFNPETLMESDILENSIAKLDSPHFQDRFHKYRNRLVADSVVGIIMDVTYVVETAPDGRAEDYEEYDRTNTVTYYYDLELDKNGVIVGGEWYQNAHPDFVWTPMRDSVVLNNEDLIVKSIEDVLRVAPAASRNNVPLVYVLDKLKMIQ